MRNAPDPAARPRSANVLAIVYLVVTLAIYLSAWRPWGQEYQNVAFFLTFMLTLPGSLGAGVIAILLESLGGAAVASLAPLILPACALVNAHFIRTRFVPAWSVPGSERDEAIRRLRRTPPVIGMVAGYLLLLGVLHLPLILPTWREHLGAATATTFVVTLPWSLLGWVGFPILADAVGWRVGPAALPFVLPACGVLNAYCLYARVGPRLVLRARQGTLWK